MSRFTRLASAGSLVTVLLGFLALLHGAPALLVLTGILFSISAVGWAFIQPTLKRQAVTVAVAAGAGAIAAASGADLDGNVLNQIMPKTPSLEETRNELTHKQSPYFAFSA
jgi:hypothetical protein